MSSEERKSISGIIGEIGERIVAYELLKRGWEVNLNMTAGFDLYIRKEDVGRRIEVKTTDPSERTGKHKKQFRFTPTNKEMEECNFVIVYYHGDSKFFIIPKDDIPDHGTIAMYRSEEGNIGGIYEQYENKWEILE